MSKRMWAAIGIFVTYILEEGDSEHHKGENTKRMRSVWTKNCLRKRDTDGYCAKLVYELRAEEPHLKINISRSERTCFLGAPTL